MKATSNSLHVTACLLVAWLAKETDSFRIFKRLISGRPAPPHVLRQSGNPENDDKAIAMSSLTKLMKRQLDNALDTEKLIEEFSEAFTSGKGNSDHVVQDRKKSSSMISAFDYGFQSRSGGANNREKTLATEDDQFVKYGSPPGSFLELGIEQFKRNLDAIRGEYKDEQSQVLTQEQISVRKMLKKLTLNATAVWERERQQSTPTTPHPIIIDVPYNVLCYFLDVVFDGRDIPSRFLFLETVARMPYFSYISCLHLYETLGFWRNSADLKRVHFAEEWNEFHHLLIMESIGGDQNWWVRFLAQHSAIAYYLILSHLFAISPMLSYKFSDMLETHAVHTYSQFLDENEDLLKQLPPSVAAVDYYTMGAFDPLFDEYKTSSAGDKPIKGRSASMIRSLYDVFDNIRNDEGEHVQTMKACFDPMVVVRSKAAENNFLLAAAGAALIGYMASTGSLSEISLTEIPFFSDELGGNAAFVEELEDSAPILLEEGGIIGFLINSAFQVFQRLL